MSMFTVQVTGRFARAALALGDGEVCALSQRGCYLRFPGGRFACVGGAALGHGPLNALVARYEAPTLGARLALSADDSTLWRPPAPAPAPDLRSLRDAAAARIPAEGLGCLILGQHNALSVHAQPALEALERWLVGHALEEDAAQLVGLGPGFIPPGDAYLGGVLVALHALQRARQAAALWRWLEPRLAARTTALSAAHLAAAADGEAHEALHDILNGSLELARLDAVGHGTGWDALAGAVAVAASCG